MASALALRGHWAHVVVFGIPVAGLVGAVAVQEIRARWGKRAKAERLDGASPHLRVAAAGLLAAAAIHVVVIPEHFREYVLFGFFFSALAVAQCLLAVLLTYRPNRQLVRCIALGSAWVILLWIASRTSGLPFGPECFEPGIGLPCGQVAGSPSSSTSFSSTSVDIACSHRSASR